ncbi:MAG: HlyD family efflux transporter periplasmic adaptor subunit, partial [Flavitalea sp.]
RRSPAVAQSIGNAVNQLDSSFRFSGTNYIHASQKGYLAEVNHQPGDYVQDGEQLAVINGSESFVFLLDLPYELRSFVSIPTPVMLVLPDNSTIPGIITATMPTVDAVSQTQRMVIKIKWDKPIPENLVAKVRISKGIHRDAVMLPDAAIVTNEEQTEFWVMKVINDSIAIKVPVKKGTGLEKETEIIEPVFSLTDKIIISGNYGLEDSAKVSIIPKSAAE